MKQIRNVVIDENQCVGCGQCVRMCAMNHIALAEGKAKALPGGCILCGHCVAICPKEAVSIQGLETQPAAPPTRLDPDEVLSVIRERRSIRRFKEQKVDRATIDKIIEAGRLTHTAKNLQDVSFTVLTERLGEAERLAVKAFHRVKPLVGLFSRTVRRTKIDDRFFFFGAPAAIVISSKEDINGALAAQNMEFVAEASGLGVLISGFFRAATKLSRRLRKLLKIPKGKKVAAVLVLGYPEVRYLRPAPRNPADVVYM